MDGWNTTFLLGRPIFRGCVSFREGSQFLSHITTFFSTPPALNRLVFIVVAGKEFPPALHSCRPPWVHRVVCTSSGGGGTVKPARGNTPPVAFQKNMVGETLQVVDIQ